MGVARDGVEAVKAASELSPDLIVMDVMMPKKDGVEACREIMESRPETRVIMLTASTEANAVIEAVAAGAASYLQKVADMDQVLAMMREAATGEGRLPTPVVRRAVDRIRSGLKTKDDVDLSDRFRAERQTGRALRRTHHQTGRDRAAGIARRVAHDLGPRSPEPLRTAHTCTPLSDRR